MAADVPGIKFDTGQTLFEYSANCFPVRSFITKGEDAGAWLVAHRAEQRRRFRAVLCTQPKTYAQIKEERRRAEKGGTTISEQNFDVEEEEKHADAPQLDGFFLMRHCCVEDPSDLCSINIMGKEISEYKEEDLALFDNVAYVNASENFLPLEAFRGFPILRELEMSLNGMRGIRFSMEDFPQLEKSGLIREVAFLEEDHTDASKITYKVLDLSYNNLSQEDILTLGLLSNLKVLHLTGNNFKTLPQNMAVPRLNPAWKTVVPYANLEILMLDDNKLADVSVFAALATMPNLKHLNLEKNEIYLIPMLQSLEGRVFAHEDEREKQRLRRSAKNSARKSARKEKSETSITEQKQQNTPEDSKSDEKKDNIPTAPPTSKATEKPEPSFEVDVTQEDLFMGNLDELSMQMNDIKIDNSAHDKGPSKGNKDVHESKNILPFPELRHINLAYNKIEDEDALLAVAAWPMLVELVIHNNPLTTENSGDPPLLKRFLGDRLGIKLARKKEPEITKLHLHVQKKKSRHVDQVVPKIPKLSVDELLMLEGPPSKTPSALKEAISSRTDIVNNLDVHTKPLPPISPSSGQPEREEVESEQPSRVPRPGEGPSDPFFMTQVEDQEAQEEKRRLEKGKKKTKLEKGPEKKVDDRYKGYEILLDVEDDPSYKPPKDMQGNIKVLKYALAHELVYRDPAVQLDRISKPVEPYRKTEVDFGPPRKTRQVKIAEALEATRTRLTTEEASLADVLAEQKTKYKGRFNEAENLLQEIQRRYNTVRVNSMKEAKEAKKLIQGSIQEIAKTKTSVRQGKRVQIDV